ncbi:MAG: hypothetical protein KKE69_12110 [Alphaproteobacteria bacterium]|nr:hypothetical protein [Alphaproteobacteria bacterium]
MLLDYVGWCKEQFALALPAAARKGNQPFDGRQWQNHERRAAQSRRRWTADVDCGREKGG